MLAFRTHRPSLHIMSPLKNNLRLLRSRLKEFARNGMSQMRQSSNMPLSKTTSGLEKMDEPQSFQDMLTFRRKQALSSVLIELSSRDDVSKATNLCKDFGGVKNFISYSGDLGNEYLLTEFSSVNAVKKFLKMCQFRTITDSFPMYSRLLRFEGRKYGKQSSNNQDGNIDNTSFTKQDLTSKCQVSKIIENVYETNKLSDLSIRKRFLFSCLIYDAMEGMFPHSAVLPFGSSVNGFGSEGCDLDVVLRLYPEKKTGFTELFFQTRSFAGDNRALQQRSISCIYEILRTFIPGISYVQKIINARVPILKFKHKILELDCDVSVNNISAVHMSEVLHFCGSLDPRVHPLVFAVKKWAKQANITYETPGSWITNFSLTLLVIFFLQNRSQAILPPLKNAVSLPGGPTAAIQYLEKPSFWREAAKRNNESLAVLLLEFFIFLSKFPFGSSCICILSGKDNSRNGGFPLWIRYPLEEDLNVSKNVSSSELERLCGIASLSAKHLENYMVRPELQTEADLSSILGISNSNKHHSERLDISELYSDDVRLR